MVPPEEPFYVDPFEAVNTPIKTKERRYKGLNQDTAISSLNQGGSSEQAT
jgi:hypothetical protein